MEMKKGFAAPAVIGVVLVLIAVVGAGYYYFLQPKETEDVMKKENE